MCGHLSAVKDWPHYGSGNIDRIGLGVFLEALKLYKDAGSTKPGLILDYARICKVEKGITPYLEAIL